MGDVLARLRAERDGLTEEEWKRRVMALGLTEAESLFERLAGTELFWYDEGGETRWGWA